MPTTITLSNVTVAVAGGPGNPRDFVGLFNFGAPNTAFLTWVYLSGGTQVRPAHGVTAAKVNLPMPAAAGQYEVRFLSVDLVSGAYVPPTPPATIVLSVNPPPPATISLSINPSQISIADNTPAGTVVATVTAVASDGSPVTLTSSQPTFIAVQGMNLVTARALTSADDTATGTPDIVTITASSPTGLTAAIGVFFP